jgi:DNA polymerase-3 subunit epsilon
LLRRAHDLLMARGAALARAELAQQVFGVAASSGSSSPELLLRPWIALLDGLLAPSPLFAIDAEGHWGLAAWNAAAQRLDEVEFVAIDVETTGLAPGRHRLIEVAGVIVHGAQIGAHFRAVINPGRRIPQFITKFTGISEAMVRRAPPASDVLPRFGAFLGARPLVGHNVGFDLGFLSYEAERCGLDAAFPLEGIDTIALARRYLSGMRRARLDRLAAALHIPVATRHRALPDALLTAQIFALLLARAREEGCETLEDLVEVQRGLAPVHSSQPLPRPTGSLYLNPAWRQSFSSRPGVYLMRDAAGDVIYVGKAKCLRDRLASYYNQPLGYTRKMDGLLQSVAAIETRVLGSELEALLVESRLIKELQPRYNVQLRNHERYPFIKVDVQQPYPRFYATKEVAADGARYFGPFRSNAIVTTTIELIHKIFAVRTCTRALPPTAPASDPCLRYHVKRCPAPCRGELDPEARERYRAAVSEACAFLGGERDDLIERLKREMFAAAGRQDFERAAHLRDALRDADQVLLGQRLVTGAVEANNLLIVYPSAEEGHVELFLIRHGRLVDLRRVAEGRTAIGEEVRSLVAQAAALGTPPARVGREEVDQINIIARWISHHSEDDERAFFRLPCDLDDPDDRDEVEAFIARVSEAAATLRETLERERLARAENEVEDVDGDEEGDAVLLAGEGAQRLQDQVFE